MYTNRADRQAAMNTIERSLVSLTDFIGSFEGRNPYEWAIDLVAYFCCEGSAESVTYEWGKYKVTIHHTGEYSLEYL